MPLNISKLGKVLKTLNRLEGIKEFNATLPVKIEVKKEINPIRYLIKLGNREVETKSNLPLIVGKKYFAQIKEYKSSIQISNLKPFPEILEILEKIPFKEKLIKFSKEEILHHLANSNSKTEFIFFTNLLLAFNEKIHYLIINEKKKALMQYKYSKNRVKFYAVFTHLGEIEGEITSDSLTIHSPYKATLRLIEQYKDKLNLNVFLKQTEVKQLFYFSENLLNLKV
jgi:hypothetical protein